MPDDDLIGAWVRAPSMPPDDPLFPTALEFLEGGIYRAEFDPEVFVQFQGGDYDVGEGGAGPRRLRLQSATDAMLEVTVQECSTNTLVLVCDDRTVSYRRRDSG